MTFFWILVMVFVLCAVCDLMKSRKPAIIAGTFFMSIGLGMILGESIKGWYYLCIGVGMVIMVGRKKGYSFRKESRKCAPILYCISVISIIIGAICMDKLFVAGVILLIGTVGIRFLDWITSPIVFKVEKHKK